MGNNNEEGNKGNNSMKTILFRFFVFGGLLALSVFLFNDTAPLPDKNLTVTGNDTPIEKRNPFEGIILEAKAAYVYDIFENKVYFTKNESAQLPLASLTKVMTALVASELLSDDLPITLSEESIAIEGDSGLKPGERWTFKNLLDYTLLVSSNDGAHAIAGAAGAFVGADSEDTDPRTRFITRMNEKANELRLEQSFFINESGLDVNSAVSGGYGSAKDVSVLTAFTVVKHPLLLEGTAYEELRLSSEDAFVHSATNTNLAIGNIPGIIASKTGFTDLAGGNVVVVFNAGINHPIVVVVLGSSYEGRFSDVKKLVAASLKKIAE